MSYSVRQNPAYGGNFSKGRFGAKVNKIVIHHAATTDFDGIGRTFKTAGRMASAHYGVGRNNNVDQYVDEADMAWHAGTGNPATNPNPSSIGIEHVNSSGAPNWSIDEKTFETSVELVRDIAKRHGLLPLKVGVNLFQHKDFAPTYCAGRMGERLQELANRVNAGGSSSGGSTGGGSSSGGKKSNEAVADEVIAGKWGNNPDRANRLRAAGYNPDTVQSIVNQKLGGGSVPKPAGKSVDQLADEVIAGAWGNGPERESRLRKAGYDYGAIQARVNQKLGAGNVPVQKPQASIGVGSTVQVTNPVDWNGTRLGVSGNYTVMELKGNRAVIGRGGVVTAAINVNNLRRV